MVAPWSGFWERNFFVDSWRWLGPVATNHFVRGAVSGVGAICLAASLAELLTLVARKPFQETWADRTEPARRDVG